MGIEVKTFSILMLLSTDELDLEVIGVMGIWEVEGEASVVLDEDGVVVEVVGVIVGGIDGGVGVEVLVVVVVI